MIKKVKTTSRDPVTTYARNVISGKIIAGPHVRAACQRHLDDLEKAPQRGFFFDLEKVKRAIGFFEDVLRLNGGQYEGKPYVLLDWQKFIVGSLFGWVDNAGLRRFRVAYVETGKGSGKSPLAAGIGLYGLVADGEARAECYAAATKKDQAMILFRDAVAMVDQSPDLSKRIIKSGTGERVWNLAYHKTGSFFRPISSDDGQSGPRPHIGLADEIHEHKDNFVVEMLRAGTKSRLQALIFMITNSGSDRTGPGWQYHEFATRIAARQLENDSFFSYVCALDEGDDPLNDEQCWDTQFNMSWNA
ncbi:terminase large subunit domain-containing protein [Nitrosomonas communis]|uniref:Phage Terminase n=1 Tax=Nitrosomonas communis TaxID=44574 RepID=A0A1I4XBF4_9PROT|nr:terminase large subunit [Nitrosomonas communis]SFN23115.1 Phage Terminase [Nitrosomonas communis]